MVSFRVVERRTGRAGDTVRIDVKGPYEGPGKIPVGYLSRLVSNMQRDFSVKEAVIIVNGVGSRHRRNATGHLDSVLRS